MTGMRQVNYTKSKIYGVPCMGDSHTFNYGLGLSSEFFYPAALASRLNAQGCRVLPRNFGVSGQTTGAMVARMASMARWEVPRMAVLYAGTNDLSLANQAVVVTASSATTFTVGTGKGASFNVHGAALVVGGFSCTVVSVAGDVLTVSGLPSTPATGADVAWDTRGNLVIMGRFLQSAGCARIVVGGQHYLNYSSGGDTPSTPVSTNVTLRALQAGAAADLGCVYCDFHAWMRNRILTGQDTQGSFSWHVLDGNVHLNGHGEAILADALAATIAAQAGWLSALK